MPPVSSLVHLCARRLAGHAAGARRALPLLPAELYPALLEAALAEQRAPLLRDLVRSWPYPVLRLPRRLRRARRPPGKLCVQALLLAVTAGLRRDASARPCLRVLDMTGLQDGAEQGPDSLSLWSGTVLLAKACLEASQRRDDQHDAERLEGSPGSSPPPRSVEVRVDLFVNSTSGPILRAALRAGGALRLRCRDFHAEELSLGATLALLEALEPAGLRRVDLRFNNLGLPGLAEVVPRLERFPDLRLAVPAGEPGAALLPPPPRGPRLPRPEPPRARAEEARPERQQPLRGPPAALPPAFGDGLGRPAPPGRHGVPPGGRPPRCPAASAPPLRPPGLPGRFRQPPDLAGGEGAGGGHGAARRPAPRRLPAPRGSLRRRGQRRRRPGGRGALGGAAGGAAADAARRRPGRGRVDHEPEPPRRPRLLRAVGRAGGRSTGALYKSVSLMAVVRLVMEAGLLQPPRSHPRRPRAVTVSPVSGRVPVGCRSAPAAPDLTCVAGRSARCSKGSAVPRNTATPPGMVGGSAGPPWGHQGGGGHHGW
ncbi:leucine-rich repeat-containing protein 14 isoform X1 [Cygnus olor]|uniref:leucine-rich repeat-containing protein 14 isoform X1 n=1 Tax=Cygnus olor TaxID=8869 RepID=UPI001ADDE671|nr:leucine-rich repeat-containing protein 14 isoform X1 [Cygnus olor]